MVCEKRLGLLNKNDSIVYLLRASSVVLLTWRFDYPVTISGTLLPPGGLVGVLLSTCTFFCVCVFVT